MVKDLPLAPLERILKKAGARRVSKSALVEFSQMIINYAHDLSAEASALAEHAGRKTIIGSDVRLAKKKLS
jgi:histone H3/H4